MDNYWYKEWFDSPLYEQLYAYRNEEEAAKLGSLLQELLPLPDYSSVLDLGCGRGRHSLYLARQGYDVTGIDLSLHAIEKARAKAEEANIQNVRFLQNDMRKPLAMVFDAVVNLFTTFGYFADDQENKKVLDSIRLMLKKEGKFIIDYLNAYRVRRYFIPFNEGDMDGISYKTRRFVEGDVINKEITFEGREIEGQKSYFEKVKLYELEWFETELSKRGFTIERTFGDYEGNKFDKDESPRLMIVAKFQG